MQAGGRQGTERGDSLAGLGTASIVVVQLMRLWLQAPDGSSRRGLGWRDGCRAAHLGDAGEGALAALMAAFAAGLADDLRVAAPTCPWIAPDEALMLHALALVQARRHAEADRALALRLPPAALRLALPAAVGLAVALEAGSLRVALRATGRSAPVARGALSDRGLALLQ